MRWFCQASPYALFAAYNYVCIFKSLQAGQNVVKLSIVYSNIMKFIIVNIRKYTKDSKRNDGQSIFVSWIQIGFINCNGRMSQCELMCFDTVFEGPCLNFTTDN